MSYSIIQRLQTRHALLEMALVEERSRPRPSDPLLARIKKKKLQIRDRLEALRDARSLARL